MAELGAETGIDSIDAGENSIAAAREFSPIFGSVLDEEAIARTSDMDGNFTGDCGGMLVANLSVLSLFSAASLSLESDLRLCCCLSLSCRCFIRLSANLDIRHCWATSSWECGRNLQDLFSRNACVLWLHLRSGWECWLSAFPTALWFLPEVNLQLLMNIHQSQDYQPAHLRNSV